MSTANALGLSCELRLDLALISSPEYDILGRRVNRLWLFQQGKQLVTKFVFLMLDNRTNSLQKICPLPLVQY